MFPHAMIKPALDLFLYWRSVTKEILEYIIECIPQFGHFFHNLFSEVLILLKPTCSIIIDEFDAAGGINDLYDSAQLYLGSNCLSDASAVRLFKPRNSTSKTAPVASLPESHSVRDSKDKVTIKWTSRLVENTVLGSSRNQRGGNGGGADQQHSLRLIFNRKHREWVSKHYINHVMMAADEQRRKSMERRLYMNRSAYPGDDIARLWSSHPFSHPSTFETLALEPRIRDDIRADLNQFVKRQDHYSRVGRAWKRGYLLYGPPGTGKTSLVAAIANELNFDVYDLELTTVPSNSHLRKLLISTAPKSVVVIEDIDCSLDFLERRKKLEEGEMVAMTGRSHFSESVSLSGVLNFVDGLWSSCGGERVIIFTTNHVERLDEALLRPGRMDKKYLLGICEAEAFRVLFKNYFDLKDEDLQGNEIIAEISTLLPIAQITPAEVGEELMRSDGKTADEALNIFLAKLRRCDSYNSLQNINSLEDDAGMDPVVQPTTATRRSKRGKRKPDCAGMAQATRSKRS